MYRTIWVLSALLFVSSAAAQNTGLGRSAPGSVGGDLGGQPGLNSGGGFNSGPSTSRTARPIFISGAVVLASGEVPAEPISIKRACGPQSYLEGYSDQKGKFGFQVGGNTAFAMTDASIGSAAPGMPQGSASSVFSGSESEIGLGVDLTGCTLVADAPGYRSSSIFLSRRRSFDRLDVGTITLTPHGGSPDILVSATSLAAPKKAKAAFEKAIKELNKGAGADPQKALDELEKAVTEYPTYAAAWTVMGETKQRLGDQAGAAESFGRAIEADSRYLRPYESMVLMAVDRQDWERAVQLASIALGLDQSNVKLQWLNAVGQFELGNHDEAFSNLGKVEADEIGAKQYPQAHHIKGLIYSQRGQYAEAVTELEQFLEITPDGPTAETIRRQIAGWKATGVV
jgi:Tfp pilus assembly protein PilF